MKKIMVMACTAVLAMGLLTACGNKAEDGAAGSAAPEENAAETENATEESGAASADKEGGKTFTVGFDAEFPDIWMRTETIPDLTWNWRQKYVRGTDGNLWHSLLTGMPKIWN